MAPEPETNSSDWIVWLSSGLAAVGGFVGIIMPEWLKWRKQRAEERAASRLENEAKRSEHKEIDAFLRAKLQELLDFQKQQIHSKDERAAEDLRTASQLNRALEKERKRSHDLSNDVIELKQRISELESREQVLEDMLREARKSAKSS